MNALRRIVDALRPALVKRAWLLRVLALFVSGTLMTLSMPNAAEACGLSDIGSCVAMIFVKIFQLLTALMGWIMVLEVDALIRVAQYHNFVNPGPSAVQVGWVVTRDLANMFFIVILLIIAFGTILGSSTYHYEKNLPRLLIMAVVINFSKTICGIFIDMGQVVMLTFVNGFKEAAGGNFVNAFQVNKLLALGESGGGTYTFGMVVAMMFAFILTTIAVSVILVMLVSLIFRVVVLWVLIILSPIAFLASAVPKGGDHYAQWWKEFKAQIIKGPIMAFFLWLALASVQKAGSAGLAGEGGDNGGFGKSSTASQSEAADAERIGDSQIPSEAGASSDTILNMIIAICLMFAGLKFGSEVGGIGTGTANAVRGRFEKGMRSIGRWGVGAATAPVAGAAKSVGGRAMNVVGTGLAKTPFLGRTPLGALGRRMALKGEDLEETQRKKREKTYASSAENLGRFSPREAGSKRGLIGATDAQKSERMGVAVQRPEVMAEMLKSGAAKQLLADGEDMVKKDPSKKAAFDSFQKAAWKAIEDPNKRKGVMAKMSGEEARKYMGAGDFTSENLDNLSKEAIGDVLKNGKAEQKAGVMGGLGDKLVDVPPGALDRFMKEKRMSWSDIPAEAYDHAALSGKGLKQGALDAASKDPSLMKRFADDPKMRDVLASTANANLASAIDGPDRAKKRAMAMMLGADKGPSTPDEEQEMGMLSLKDLNELDRNAPVDSREIQEAIDRGITAALKHGTAEMAQSIMNSPTLSQRVPLTQARDAAPSTPGFTSGVDRAANTKIADLDRQRKEPSPPPGIDAAIADLRKAIGDVKSASKDLSDAEKEVAKHREDYGAAQKTGNTAGMKALAATIKAALSDVEKKRTALASANVALKAKT